MRKRHRSRASTNVQSNMQLEHLESRRLMASAKQVFSVGNIDTSPPTSLAVRNLKEGPMSNTGGNLVDLYLDYRGYRAAGGKDANYVAPSKYGLWTTGSKVGVTIRGLIALPELTNVIREHGGGIIYRTRTFNAIDAVVPITMLHALAIHPSIASINPITDFQTAHQGVANNQADEAQIASLVRSTYGVDGTGLKIGVISTSVNRLGNGIAGSIATGDLPASGVQVLSDSTSLLDPEGTLNQDEGRAMLELIHDIAPGAELAFATGIGGQQIFADAIRALRAAGCDIIVDDLGYFDEPFFQPGIISQAITDVVSSGALYVTAAGNAANNGFDTPIRFTTSPGPRLVDWDPGPAVDTRLRISLSNPGPEPVLVKLQWDDPYNGIAGNVGTDLDIYAFDAAVPSRIRGAGTANNLRTGVPIETMLLNSGSFDLQIRVADSVPGRALPTRVKVIFIHGEDVIIEGGELAVEYDPTIIPRSTIFGHAGTNEAISVGAVPFFSAPPFSNTTPILSELFSSYGTVTQVFDASGNRLPTPRTLLKPDISGIDGANTSFFTGSTTTPLPGEGDNGNDADFLPNFFGTSAAAPNVAASLALIRQAAPSASAEAIINTVQATATPLNGQTPGTHDQQAGFGLIDTFAAIESFVAPPVVQQIIVPQNPSFGGIDQIRIVFSQQVSGFTVADLRLIRGDNLANILTGDQRPVAIDGGRTWVIPNLSVLTAEAATYTLTLFDSEGDIVNPIGLPLTAGAETTFEVLPAPQIPEAPSNTATKAISPTVVRVRWIDNSGLFETGFQIERSETPDFTSRVTRFTVGRNVTVFTDSSPNLAGKQLYYRVRAFNNLGQFSAFSSVSAVTTPSPGEVILDNESSAHVAITGTWNVDDSVPGFLGSSYLDDLNSGKGTNRVTFAPNLPFNGEYFVYARWTRAVDRATNVPIDINSAGGRKTVRVNQRDTGGAGWVLLGKFTFKAGKLGSVVIRTDGTNGRVIVDAVRFLPAGT